ncbi:MAG: GNAT family N-acetyltransferase [Lachnospiraceae bacterium]|nr:GNAT family N-acetyltransferase [Lachnospiraceae bacterium]
MYTKQQIFEIAMEQSATDNHCTMEDFLKPDHVMVDFALGEQARKYYKEPITCNFVSYGSNIVVSVKPEYRELVWKYLHKFEFYHCFETPSMNWLAEQLTPMGQKICFMAEYFLPDPDRLTVLSCDYEIKILEQRDFSSLYRKEWSNALCEDRKELDVLGAGAYDNGKLIGLAACSADCDSMWQIGVDVLPEYRRKGIASALTSRLAIEILKRDKVPFYCCAWSNICSARNAIRSGFVPAWVEMTVKPAEIVDKMNE